MFKFLFIALFGLAMFSCSDDDNGSKQQEKRTTVKAWPIVDGNFLTQEDVILSEDLSQISISKAYINTVVDKSVATRAANGSDDTILEGDVLGVYMYGMLYYFKVTSVDDSGEVYKSCKVERITLEDAVSLANLNLGDVKLSTDIYVDESKPKRVNNAGEADSNGKINTDIYIEHSNGETIYHPMAMAVQAVNPKANADGVKEEIPGAYIGAYVGQASDIETANGWFSTIASAGKAFFKTVIKPIATAVEAVSEAGDLLKKISVGGEYKKELTWLDMEFNIDGVGKEWPSGDKISEDPIEDEDDVWTNTDFKAKMKGKAKISVDGKVKAKYGNEIFLKFQPGRLQEFSVRTRDEFSAKLTLNAQFGVEQSLKKEFCLLKFPTYCFTFMLGPLPIVVVGYPEIIWSNKAKGEVTAYISASYSYTSKIDKTSTIYPTSTSTVNEQDRGTHTFTLEKCGFSLNATASTGLFFRNSLTLCGLIGPTFDLGMDIKFKGAVDIVKKKDQPWQMGAKLGVTRNFLLKSGGVFRIPGLESVSEWLAKKTTFECEFIDWTIHTDTIYAPKLDPIEMKELFDYSILSTIEDEEE